MEVDYSYKFLNSTILRLAISEAEKSQHHQRVAAVIFKGKRVISYAFNEVRSNNIPHRFKNFPQSAHAECLAIKKAFRNLKGYDMLVIRINKKGELRLAKSCDFCESFAQFCGVRNIYYSNNKGMIVKEED